MEPLRPIFWGQGMFLQPQHFQQQDCYHEARWHHYLYWLAPFAWGIKSLVIREAAMQNFVCDIERCELVTWDGTLVCFQGDAGPSNVTLRPRSFEDVLDAGGRPLGVYLGVKRLQWDEATENPWMMTPVFGQNKPLLPRGSPPNLTSQAALKRPRKRLPGPCLDQPACRSRWWMLEGRTGVGQFLR